MDARAAILQKLARGHKGSGSYAPSADGFTEQPDADPLQRFMELAKENLATVDQVAAPDDVPVAIVRFLGTSDQTIMVDSKVLIQDSAWQSSGLKVMPTPVHADGDVLLSDCYGAVAENGAVVLSTGDHHAMANDFLARTHVVLLPGSRIFKGLADLWQALRDDAGNGPLPREFCLVTGPSRTADLGVPAKMGAHGPAAVHIIIVG